jgi:phospholipase/carboxylesterase
MALPQDARERYALGRLSARLPEDAGERGAPADAGTLSGAAQPVSGQVRPLGLGGRRDGVLIRPAKADVETRLLVALHGAGGSGRQMVDLLEPAALRRGLAVLAPDARGTSWDLIGGGYGPDVAFLDDALAQLFSAYRIAAPVVVSGFSDGASYALSLGIANGDLFERVIAWSPGFAAPATRVGTPQIFVSHGVTDRVLPIDRCSRRLVPVLRDDGYEVTYEEFDDGHRVPATVVERALDWALS